MERFGLKNNFGFNNLRPATSAVQSMLYDKGYSHVSLFRRNFWASKVMYRGSAAGVLVERGFCSNPPQTPQKDDCVHLVDFLRRHYI